MEQKDRYIRFDWAAKRLLRNKANFGVLEDSLPYCWERISVYWRFLRAKATS